MTDDEDLVTPEEQIQSPSGGIRDIDIAACGAIELKAQQKLLRLGHHKA